METKIRILAIFLTTTILTAGFTSAQEYDDMYFTPKDRKALDVNKPVSFKNIKVEDVQTNFEETDPQVSFSQQNVNPDYIARYSAESFEEETDFSEDEFYVEQGDESRAPVVNNYYYGNQGFDPRFDPFLANQMAFNGAWGGFYDPWMMRPGWNVSIGFGAGWGWGRWNRWNRWNAWARPGWNVGFGFGNAWGGGFYDPFWCPPGAVGFYDPFFNPWRNNVVVINNIENRGNRSYVRGVGPTRGGAIASRSRARNSVAVTDGQSIRSGRSASRVATNTRSRYTDGTNSRSSYYRRSRSVASNETAVSRPSRRSSYSDRSGYSRSDRSSSNYSRSSRSSRSSYGTTSGSRSRSSYGRSSSGQRSSGYNRSSTGSRSRSSGYSSGSSRSRSSGFSSGGSRRSSGMSSGSRSGGSRSSGASRSSGSRRGN